MVMRHAALSVLLSGATGIAAQIILLRELVVSFQGNELSIGIILATWLLIEALGCIVAGKIAHHLKNPPVIFALTQIAMAASLAVGILVARSARLVMGLPLGVGLGIDAMFVVSVLALFPVALLHGASFAWASRVMGGQDEALNRVYIYETLGTMVGSAGLTFVLIPIMHSYQLALVVMVSAMLSVIVLWWGGGGGHDRQRTLRTLGCVGLSLLALYPLSVGFSALHDFSLQVQWASQTLVSHKNSVYGNLAVIERAGEYLSLIHI